MEGMWVGEKSLNCRSVRSKEVHAYIHISLVRNEVLVTYRRAGYRI